MKKLRIYKRKNGWTYQIVETIVSLGPEVPIKNPTGLFDTSHLILNAYTEYDFNGVESDALLEMIIQRLEME